jgi:hypothetical protein
LWQELFNRGITCKRKIEFEKLFSLCDQIIPVYLSSEASILSEDGSVMSCSKAVGIRTGVAANTLVVNKNKKKRLLSGKFSFPMFPGIDGRA